MSRSERLRASGNYLGAVVHKQVAIYLLLRRKNSFNRAALIVDENPSRYQLLTRITADENSFTCVQRVHLIRNYVIFRNPKISEANTIG